MNWRLGVVGSPIEHSLSPRLHEAGLRLAGLKGSSSRVELATNARGELRALLGGSYDALSVTAPLKGAAFATCDEVSDVARRTRSVNSLLVRDGRIEGASTDGEGFIEALRHETSLEVADLHAVVLGSGGAASAVVDALIEHGVASLVVHARNEERAQALTAPYPNAHTSSLVYRPIDLVINTIPAAGRARDAAVLQGVHRETTAVDITYEPRRSPWLVLYEASGCRTMNGLAMLAHQAALQLSWWFGVALSGAELLEVLHD